MEMRHLHTFKAVVETGNFTKAAELLNYSQSTVTFHIRAIEDELGTPIFDRIGKKVLLTEAGKQLFPHATQMLTLYKNLKESVGNGGEVKGKIVVSAPEALFIYRLPPLIKELTEEFPSIDLELKHLDSLSLKTELSHGNVDVALLIDDVQVEEEICYEKLCEESMMLISADPINRAEQNFLSGQTLLFTEKGCVYRKAFEKVIEQSFSATNSEKVTPTSSLEFWSIEAIKQCILCGFGVSVLPYSAVRQEIQQNLLYAQPVDTKAGFSIYLCYHKNKWLSPSMQVFMNLLRKHMVEWR
ncbi:LysR family transcriptional regulator [Caldalkalibacillus mannanilyticus]|uniref:LysR family transcriptional regulator n=1 Tax=Caldalkalibacillus mannanilyticus TaxID=1418 RepID=UPI00046A9D9A|nr:LysR family transcriptional regulator [Caldalkalibacillus mannanilyticus]